MWEHRGKVAAVGLGHSPVIRSDDGTPEHTVGSLARDAALKAIADAGIESADVDGLSLCGRQPFEGSATNNPELGHHDGIDSISAKYLVENMGQDGLNNLHWIDESGGMVGHALINAVEAIAAGKCSVALVVRALHNPRGVRYGHGGNNATERIAGNAQFTVPYGLTGPAQYGMMYQRYLWKYGQTRDKMAAFAIHQRKFGLLNENSYWHQHRPEPLTEEEYFAGRMISAPLSINDCDLPVQGAAAWLLASADRAKAMKQKPVFILGHATGRIPGKGVLGTLEEAEDAAAELGRKLWESSGLSPKDADVANAYDGFLPIAAIWIESVGFLKRGEFLDFVRDGGTEVDGQLPITSGGNNGCGRMHGCPHFYDPVQQIQGRAGGRQVKNPQIAVTVIGPHNSGQGIVWGDSPN